MRRESGKSNRRIERGRSGDGAATAARRPITRCHPDYEQGLTEEQVQERKHAGWANLSVDPPSKTVGEIVKENVFTYFNLIFAILAILLIIVGSFRNLTFLPIIIANIVIGIFQEIRAKQSLDKLTMLHAPSAEVVRDGEISRVKAEELVVDDIVIFKTGDQICADAVVVEGTIQVNESLLTGETDEITKNPGDTLMSGSFVVTGECHARLENVGADSYISKLTLQAKALPEGEQSEMMRSLDRLIKIVGICILPLGIALFVQSMFFNGETFRSSIESMVAAVIGMIPEGLYLLTSTAMAVSTIRLANRHVMLHDMKSIETLARVNVLCVDKTGTITENKMTVQKLIPAPGYDRDKMSELEKLIGDFVGAMAPDNATMEALKECFTKKEGRKADNIVPFTSVNKYSAAQMEDTAYVLGAPDIILREDYEEYKDTIEEYASKGYRVLVFGTYDGELDGKALTQPVEPLGYILLANPIRKSAKATFQYFADQGVDVKVISGDNPVTVSEVAKQAGIPHADQYVDASTLKTKKEIYRAAAKKTVFGRVTPEQKRWLVKALQRQGKTVAMTGDGVNDVLALKDADCSVAMASGSDAAVQASQVVLLDSDFSCMPDVVAEGRRVVNNIQCSATVFLVKNIFSFLLSLFSVTLMITYPLEPSQISLISMFTIGTPAFFLSQQPNHDRIEGDFLTNVLLQALPAGITDFLVVGALVIFGQTFGVNAVDISTAATMLLAIVGFMILFRICEPFNTFRVVIWFGCVLGMLGSIIFLPDLFAISGMSTRCIMLFVVFAIVTEPMLRYLSKLAEDIQQRYLRSLRARKTEKPKKIEAKQ